MWNKNSSPTHAYTPLFPNEQGDASLGAAASVKLAEKAIRSGLTPA